MSQHNEGIIIKGGSVNSEQIVAGQNAQAIKNIYTVADELRNSDKEQVARALTELLQSLENPSNNIPEKQEVIQAVQQIAEEAKKEKPSKLTLKSLLDGVKTVVEPLADIAQKVVALRGAIALILGIPTL